MSVTLEHVTLTVDGIPTIRDVSLTLERGTLSVLLGPTLSGKTSIMRLLAGLDKPTTGRVLVDGKDVTGADVRQRSVAARTRRTRFGARSTGGTHCPRRSATPRRWQRRRGDSPAEGDVARAQFDETIWLLS